MIRDTLLVIDDSPLDLAILREIFRSLFQVECFEESRPALAYIHRNPERICAVLLDLCLGKRGAGFSVLQQLQTAENTWDVPVILITSDAQEEQVLKAARTGATDFLVKPVDPVTVQERVCGAVRAAWPAGSTILDSPLSQPDNPPQASQDDNTLLLADHWDRLLELFIQARPHFSLAKYHALGQITAALANGYRKNNPNCSLTQEDVQLIGRAAVYCDVGLLGVPDTVLEQGPDREARGSSSICATPNWATPCLPPVPPAATPCPAMPQRLPTGTTKTLTAPATPPSRPPTHSRSVLSWPAPPSAVWAI